MPIAPCTGPMLATPKTLIEDLHRACGEIVNESLTGEREGRLASRYILLDQLRTWDQTLIGRAELRLFETAQAEYIGATLSVCQGRYRSAFKSLRLSLELYLQGLLLSVDELAMVEWLANQRDTVWATIVDPEKGVFSSRFTRAFFAELDDSRKNMETLSRTLYRELSECTHGNIPRFVSIPPKLYSHKSASKPSLQNVTPCA